MDYRLRVDEAEGSPSQDGANRFHPEQLARGWTAKIDRSAEALRVFHHPPLFPSYTRSRAQHRAGDCAAKTA